MSEYKEKFCHSCGKWRGPEVRFTRIEHKKGFGCSYRCQFCMDLREQAKNANREARIQHA